jgi:dTDP-4-amino-4,6-dideoxygalactose transaminase
LYREIWDGRPLPVTEWVSDRVISLPIYSSLSDEDVDRICAAVSELASEAAQASDPRKAQVV